MKHVKIVLTLTLTVVVFSLAVFFVEDLTKDQILANIEAKANAAKFEVMPDLDTVADVEFYSNYFAPECDEGNEKCNDTEYDFSGTTISKLNVIPGKGYIYEASSTGYAGEVIYLIALDMDKNITGFRVVSQSETKDLGANITLPVFTDLFVDAALADVQSGDIVPDVIGGATPAVTIAGLRASLGTTMTFHDVTFGGAVVETPEEKLARYYAEITTETAIFSDVSADYTLPVGTTKVELATDGEEDIAIVYTIEFTSSSDFHNTNGVNEYMVSVSLDTGNILGLRVLQANDTLGYGADMIEDVFAEQFVDMTQEDALGDGIDEQAGSSYPITLAELVISLTNAINFHKVEFEGAVILTPEEQLQALKEELQGDGGTITDVSGDLTLKDGVTNVQVVNDGAEDVAVFLEVEFTSPHTEAGMVNRYAVAVDMATGNVISVTILEVNDTPGVGNNIANEEFYSQFTDMTQQDALDGAFDGVAGATNTSNAFGDSLNDSIEFYITNFEAEPRPDNVNASDEFLLLAFPGADNFVSIYESYDYQEGIGNIYAARDAGNTVIGVVYVATYQGNNGAIYFVWGLDLDGNAIGVEVLIENETWASAPGYDGNDGFALNDTTWVTQFEGIHMTEVMFNPVDAIAGVSITTGGFIETIETIVEYHLVEVVGGAN